MKCHIREVSERKFVKGIDSCYRVLGFTEDPNEAGIYRKSTGKHVSDMINTIEYDTGHEDTIRVRTTKAIFD